MNNPRGWFRADRVRDRDFFGNLSSIEPIISNGELNERMIEMNVINKLDEALDRAIDKFVKVAPGIAVLGAIVLILGGYFNQDALCWTGTIMIVPLALLIVGSVVAVVVGIFVGVIYFSLKNLYEELYVPLKRRVMKK